MCTSNFQRSLSLSLSSKACVENNQRLAEEAFCIGSAPTARSKVEHPSHTRIHTKLLNPLITAGGRPPTCPMVVEVLCTFRD